jgi:hypothetical protein
VDKVKQAGEAFLNHATLPVAFPAKPGIVFELGRHQ